MTLDFQARFSKAYRTEANLLTSEEEKEQIEEEKMHASKLAEVEKSRSPINFFVPSIY